MGQLGYRVKNIQNIRVYLAGIITTEINEVKIMNRTEAQLIANYKNGRMSFRYFARHMAKVAVTKNRKFVPHKKTRNEHRYK